MGAKVLKSLGLIIDVIFVSLVMCVSIFSSYLVAEIFEQIKGRQINTSSLRELTIVLTPWMFVLIYSRHIYIYRLKAKMGKLSNFGFMKPRKSKRKLSSARSNSKEPN